MKLLTVIGARPQFIKAATVSRVVADRNDVREVIVHTGQHYDADMSDVFFEELSIPKPDYQLGIGGGGHGQMTGRQMEAIEKVLISEKPDWVLVYGDTNSTLAGALAAVKLHIPLAHVEAGLRSFNRKMPEEINRILTDHAADLLCAPTESAIRNLQTEGFPAERLRLVGDVMYDAALFYREHAKEPAWFKELSVRKGNYILATIHRAESTDNPACLEAMLQGLAQADSPVILPLHPRTRARINEFGLEVPKTIHVVQPTGYLEMIWLEMHSAAVATDSGGVQKEAYFHGRPCVTLREQTEWVELVESGWNTLVGADTAKIAAALSSLACPEQGKPLYGDGNAAELIVDLLCGNAL